MARGQSFTLDNLSSICHFSAQIHSKDSKLKRNVKDLFMSFVPNKPEIHSEPKPRGKRIKQHNKWQIVMQFSLQHLQQNLQLIWTNMQ